MGDFRCPSDGLVMGRVEDGNVILYTEHRHYGVHYALVLPLTELARLNEPGQTATWKARADALALALAEGKEV